LESGNVRTSAQRITFTPFHRNSEKGTRKDCDFARPNLFSAGKSFAPGNRRKDLRGDQRKRREEKARKIGRSFSESWGLNYHHGESHD
jgi:hypothetical protein